jgi:hypothetical protein
MQTREDSFKEILTDVVRTYQNKMHDYLTNKPDGSITDADVVLMVMNLTINVSANIYRSIKEYLPTTTVDFDFMRAKMINAMADEFEKVKVYKPEQGLMPLTTDQIKEIMDKGHAVITMPDGTEKKVHKDDLLLKKEDVDKFAKEAKRETVNANTPKIIIPGRGTLRQ